MSSKPTLKLDWCSHEAAKYAVEKWHYSKRMPKSKLAKIGVWEDDRFIGCVIFGVGATPEIAKPYRLKSTEVCELVRVALTRHITQTSRIVAIAVRMIRSAMPGIRLIVSYADTQQGHHGGIYQAGGWLMTGTSADTYIKVNGKIEHRRVLSLRYGTNSLEELKRTIDPKAERVAAGMKHKYLMPLDDEIRKRIEPLRKPYPKRVTSIASDVPVIQTGEGGATPTVTLSSTLGQA